MMQLESTAAGALVGLAACGLGIVAFGNAVTLLGGRAGPERGLAEFGPLAVLVAVLLWARLERLSLGELGFTLRGFGGGLAWGTLAGFAMAVLAIAFFAFPVIAPQRVEYAGYRGLEIDALAALLLVRLPIRTVLVEETCFRGLLQTLGVRLLGARQGIVLSSTFFVLWHGVVTYQAIGLTNLAASAVPVPLLWVLAALPLAAAGVIFGLLRLRSGSLAAPMLAHWLVNSCMALFLANGAFEIG